MGFKVLLVLFAISMLLTSGTERSKEVSARGRRLCLCSDRVLRLSSQDSEASSSATCEEMCTFNRNTGVLSTLTRRRLRSRRDVFEDAKNCNFNLIHDTWKVNNTKVAFHRSVNSSEWFAEVSWSPFNGSSFPWLGYYIIYFIGSVPPDRLDCKNLPKNQTIVNISSTEDDTTINLYVSALPLSLNSTNRSAIERMPLNEYTWREKKFLTITPPVLNLEPTEEKDAVTTYVSISAGILAGIILAAALLKYCLCREKISEFPPEFKFHAFIIYQNEDSHWVSKQLLPFLEEEHHIKCCIHYRDFTPGLPFLDSMAESVYNSYKIIAVFSSNFLQSKYCNHELNLAQYRLLNRRDDSLIIIRIDKTDPSKLPHALQKRNFIDYSDALERPFWKDRLLKFLNSGSKSVSIELDNNNSALNDSNEENEHRSARAQFDRLNSTTSTATQISMISISSANEDRLV